MIKIQNFTWADIYREPPKGTKPQILKCFNFCLSLWNKQQNMNTGRYCTTVPGRVSGIGRVKRAAKYTVSEVMTVTGGKFHIWHLHYGNLQTSRNLCRWSTAVSKQSLNTHYPPTCADMAQQYAQHTVWAVRRNNGNSRWGGGTVHSAASASPGAEHVGRIYPPAGSDSSHGYVGMLLRFYTLLEFWNLPG